VRGPGGQVKHVRPWKEELQFNGCKCKQLMDEKIFFWKKLGCSVWMYMYVCMYVCKFLGQVKHVRPWEEELQLTDVNVNN
jgi:hypothetical protein